MMETSEKSFNVSGVLKKVLSQNDERKYTIAVLEKNYKVICKSQNVDLYSDYYTLINSFIEKTISFTKNHSESFEDERAILLKEANLLQKEKNKSSYKKDKHKKDKYNDGN